MTALAPAWNAYYFHCGINAAGDIVANILTERLARGPVVFRQGKIVDLNAAIDPVGGWMLEDVRGINDSGQIVGWGEHNGKKRGFLLTPVSASSRL